MGGGQAPVGAARSSYPKMASEPIPVMRHVSQIYEERLNQFIANGQYAGSNLRSKLHEATVSGSPHVKLSVYSPPDCSRPTFKDATSHTFKKTRVGESFGPSWSTHWFKVQLTVPAALRKKEHLELHWDANNEGMIWNEKGEPLQGLTGGGERVEWILPEDFRDGREHTFYIEMACNGMFGNAVGDIIQAPDPNRYFQLTKAEVVAVNLQARALFIDFWILKDAAREFPREGWQEHEALRVANEIMDCFQTEDVTDDCIRQCRKIAAKYLGKQVDSANVYDGERSLITAVGHCHIDTCWLWPWAETKRKIARSWSNQCDLMDRYPEHRFACSQAQQYKWLKQYYPSVFDRVKTKVKEGKFQPIGGSWVEHDTNLPCGESLVRQFLYGQRFFQSHFGERSRTFWLPDTFGYSSQLPQLCRLAGMERFFTQKLSWNNINNFPHSTFNWVGIDNSQVLCHMAPAETYTAEADLGDVVRSMTQHKSKDQDATSILPFGKGDGGGGPTWQQIEKLRRCRGISNEVGHLAPVKVGDSVDDFFAALEEKAAAGTEYVSWHGELYLELHRGCYTTQANNKRNNRLAERMLHEIERIATVASLQVQDYQYPKAGIDTMWEDVLLMQFHDCLPGSCIEMVYRDSDELYKSVFQAGEKLLMDAWAALKIQQAPKVESAPKVDSPHRDVHLKHVSDDHYILENLSITVTIKEGVITSFFDKRQQRELVPAGRTANQLVIFDDKPLYWQAWDVEVYHLNTRKALKSTSTIIAHDTPSSVALTTFTRISAHSTIATTISLSHPTNALLAFSCTTSWHEPTQKFLKVEFPTTLVSNTGTASYETQYGLITRPTHYNTSWDLSKFEVVTHRFADLSEHNYGLSLLNDCKYGFSVVGSTMRLSLLRSPKAPDANADMGIHHFRYAMLAHEGPLGVCTTTAAREFNAPVRAPEFPSEDGKGVRRDVPLFPHTSIFTCAPGVAESLVHVHPEYAGLGYSATLQDRSRAWEQMQGVTVDWVKRGEDDEDVRGNAEECALPVRVRKGKSVIVRVYEALGGRSRCMIRWDGQMDVEAVYECNLLEDDIREMDIVRVERTWNAIGGFSHFSKGRAAVSVSFGPFEVKTFRFCVA